MIKIERKDFKNGLFEFKTIVYTFAELVGNPLEETTILTQPWYEKASKYLNDEGFAPYIVNEKTIPEIFLIEKRKLAYGIDLESVEPFSLPRLSVSYSDKRDDPVGKVSLLVPKLVYNTSPNGNTWRQIVNELEKRVLEYNQPITRAALP